MDGWLTTRVKAGLLDVQNYVRLLRAVGVALVTPPFYFRDVVEQLESIGVGSLAVVLLTGAFTGAVLALQIGLHAGPVRGARGGRPPGERVDGEGARAGPDRR